jgi:hypothetical protein
MRKCFVISPIGPERSPTREHADDVYDYIIRPAMEACGLAVLRSDHLHEPGKITDQMYRELFGSDLCIAVLTGYNPNVFYELALAQAACRPLIVMIEAGHELPFDIRDLRCVAYDLKPRSLFERVHANQLVAHVRNLEAQGWRVSSPFGKYAELLRPAAPSYLNEVFFSCPMSGTASEDEFQELRAAALQVLGCLEGECGLRVVYSGRSIGTRAGFDEADFAVVGSIRGMTESRYYLLIYPDRLVSSVLVEAGMALALGRPSVYFVRDRKHLPFLLQHVDKTSPVKVYEYETFDRILALVRQFGPNLFETWTKAPG